MADREGGQKTRSVWPWIVGAVGLGLLILLLILLITAPPPAAVREYLATCTNDVDVDVEDDVEGVEIGGEDEMDFDHEYTSNCVRLLVAAVDAVADEGSGVPSVYLHAQLLDAYENASRLVQSPDASLDHADMAREAFISIAAVLDSIQGARYPDLDSVVVEMEEAARALRSDVPFLEQPKVVEAFFRSAGVVLRRMVE